MSPRAGRIALGVVGVVLLVAGVAKAMDGASAAGLLAKQTSSESLARGLTAALAGLETALGVLLVLRGGRAEAWAGTGLLVVLTAWLAYVDVTLGMSTPCGCGIPFLADRGWTPILRNFVLLGTCAVALRRSRPVAP